MSGAQKAKSASKQNCTEDKGRIAIYFREDLNVRKRVIWNAFARLAAPLLIVLPILFAVISWIVSAAMRPIDRLGHALGERGEGNLDPITAQSDVPAEIDRMQRSVNQLLERLRKTVSVERRFISQAAHELRTPVAAAMAQNERLLGVLTTANEIEKAQNVHSSLVRPKRLCERLLEHAKAEGGVGAAQRKMDMRDIVGLVVREFETRDAQGRIDVDLPDTPVMQSIDPDGYAIILRNLFDNALVHGDADGLVRVTLSERGVLSVQNNGPTIPFDKCRAIESGSNPLEPSLNGNGMGLHIVRKIADAMSMTVSVTSPVTQDGGGARFTIAPKGLVHRVQD